MNNKIQKTIQLFLTFIKIGAFTFGGGYAMLPLIQKEIVEKKHWITDNDILEIVAISESTPGPIAINAATFVGFRICGFWGALFATLGVVIPSYLIILIISFVLKEFQSIKIIQYAFNGIRAGVLALIIKALWSMYIQCPKNIISYIIILLIKIKKRFRMFEKILIANRGEIAIRVMRACRELDIQSVAIYSDADTTSLYTNYADESYPLGNPSPAKSYLNIEKIIDIALESGADAIHPGYGFLAENPKFGEACEKNGIKLIGPTGDVIHQMGDKITSKALMKKAGVPVIEGTPEGVSDIEEAKEIARQIGYPVIVKASAGGGGIGMRAVYEEDELVRAIESTQSVASTNFGDSTVFIEKYLEKPRHIEFQLLADEHGNVIHVADRECSIQRRHQKLLEEAPSPIMTEELRAEMGASAVKAAEYIGYTSAGTVEFLYDNGQYYFLEMNTRIQVEHPITELVTNTDLIKEQIKIANGDELSYEQKDIQVSGHAIECRINAEDPLNDFAPNPGKITGYRSPGGPGVRLDSGVYMNYTIPTFYDSMISKLVTWGRTRDDSIARMKRALSEYIILGVKTTIPFHKAILRNPNFISGDLNTHFIDQYKNGIESEMVNVIAEDLENVNKMKSTFMPSKKIAAISAAVGSYLNTAKNQQMNKK